MKLSVSIIVIFLLRINLLFSQTEFPSERIVIIKGDTLGCFDEKQIDAINDSLITLEFLRVENFLLLKKLELVDSLKLLETSKVSIMASKIADRDTIIAFKDKQIALKEKDAQDCQKALRISNLKRTKQVIGFTVGGFSFGVTITSLLFLLK